MRASKTFTGRAVPKFVHWEDLNLAWKTIASIDPQACIECGLCHIACEDTAHQAIRLHAGGGEAAFTR